jgi:predicted AlkP superfamily pyrophosphatase or phosphodiesterase
MSISPLCTSQERRLDFEWMKPLPGQNFWDRASWVREHYAKGKYRRFFAFFVDGIGYSMLKFLQQIYADELAWIEKGQLEAISSLYPSTTSVHVPAFLGGALPEQTGVVEWWYYEPLIETLLSPLKLKRRDGKEEGEELAQKIYQPLLSWPQGPKRVLWQESSYSYSPVTRHLAGGFELMGYEVLEDLAQKIREKTQEEEVQFHVVYLPQADTMSHRMGPDHPRTLEVWRDIFNFIRALLLDHEGADTCFISDHGQSSVNPEQTIYLNHHMPGLKEAFLKDDKGKILTPAGSCRNMLLYLEKSKVAEWKPKLEAFLGSKAQIFTKETLINEGFFLSNPSGRFYKTFPELVIMPRLGESVWWDEGKPIDVRSQHGGASRQEMEVPFWRLLNSRISFEG